MKAHQPGGHIDQMMRQTRGNLIQLSSMADVKSRRRMTRWPMAAMAALWVITAVVVPTSRFTRSSTCSTSLPVS